MKQAEIEKKVLEMIEANKYKEALEYLTKYTTDWGEIVVKKAWKLGDLLWTRYDEKF